MLVDVDILDFSLKMLYLVGDLSTKSENSRKLRTQYSVPVDGRVHTVSDAHRHKNQAAHP